MYKHYRVKVKETNIVYATIVAKDEVDAHGEVLDGAHINDSELHREHSEDELISIEEVSDE